ncbi:uncharacterized protein PRD47_017177 isoform 2-T2 [Ara ararauna]
MRPQEKLFFKSPAAIALQHLASITQGARVAAPGEHRAASSSALPRLARGQQVAPSIWESMGGYGAPHCRSSPPCAPHRSSTPRPVGVTSPAHTGKVPPAPAYLGFTLTPNPAFTHSDPAAPAATQLPGGQPLSPAGAPPDSQHPAVAPGQRLRGRAHPLGLQRRRKDPESGGFLPKPPRPTQPLAIGHAPFAKAPPLCPYMILISLNPSPHLHM